MQIWIDGDACPNQVKTIVFKAAQRRHVMTYVVANQLISTPPGPWIKAIRVESGFDEADRYIIEHVQAQDIVITADVPLAAAVVQRQANVIEPRGKILTSESIQERQATRDLMEQLRSTGTISGGPAPFDQKSVQAFANSFDRLVTQAIQASKPSK